MVQGTNASGDEHNSCSMETRMADLVEKLRRERLAEINAEPGSRAALEARYGQVYETQELQNSFSVTGFMAPYVVARRLSDGVVGSLEFQHGPPRLYFNFQPHSK
jgi:hypothetical protein